MTEKANPTPKFCDTKNATKYEYIRPKLTVHGRVAELTAGGSINKTENNGHPNGRF